MLDIFQYFPLHKNMRVNIRLLLKRTFEFYIYFFIINILNKMNK